MLTENKEASRFLCLCKFKLKPYKHKSLIKEPTRVMVTKKDKTKLIGDSNKDIADFIVNKYEIR